MQGLPQHITIGTAGHVDHGKSTLVQALTGINPDRLAEEQARSMTIDLGFAWLTLPSGRSVSIVDVPGHERFIKNMLAGVGGIDAALLIVAADEGPMPQTDEHLAILDLLRIERGVVVLTKADVVDDEWLGYVAEEVRERVAGTVMADAPIVPVSAVTGRGLPELLRQIELLVDEVPPRAGGQRPRLPIDRVFSVAGFGTVVTGTLTGGTLRVGQAVRIEPSGLESRIRGLQSHKQTVEEVGPGTRVAVNLSGISVEDLQRGDVLTRPGVVTPTDRIDARLTLLPQAPMVLEQNALVDFFVGTTEVPARVTLLDAEKLTPGDSGWVQYRFPRPIAVLKGDRFIIRRPSPSDTIGGGEVVTPTPRRHKRFQADVIASLETLAKGSPAEIVLQLLEERPRTYAELLEAGPHSFPEDQVANATQELIETGQVLVMASGEQARSGKRRPGDYLIAESAWRDLLERLRALLAAYHEAQPLRRGMPRQEAMNKLGITPPRLFDEIVSAAQREGLVHDDGATVRLAEFRIELPPALRAKADAYIEQLRQNPFTPPAPSEAGLDPETIGALADRGEVVILADNVVFPPDAFTELVRGTIAYIEEHGSITLAQFRDTFNTSRKYAQAALEYLDRQKLTRRIGDDRVLGPAAPTVSAGISHATEGETE